MRTYFSEKSLECASMRCCCGEDRIVDVRAVQRLNSLASACMEDLEDKGTWILKLKDGVGTEVRCWL